MSWLEKMTNPKATSPMAAEPFSFEYDGSFWDGASDGHVAVMLRVDAMTFYEIDLDSRQYKPFRIGVLDAWKDAKAVNVDYGYFKNQLGPANWDRHPNTGSTLVTRPFMLKKRTVFNGVLLANALSWLPRPDMLRAIEDGPFAPIQLRCRDWMVAVMPLESIPATREVALPILFERELEDASL